MTATEVGDARSSIDRSPADRVSSDRDPGATNAAAPAVLLLPAIAGINDYIRERARRLERCGFRVDVVDYYAGRPAPDLSSPQHIAAAVAQLADGAVLAEIRRRIDALAARADVDRGRIALMGYCIGGTYAMLAGAAFDGLAAVVNYYGGIRYGQVSTEKPVAPIDRVAALRAPMICHYGTADAFVPPTQVAELEAALNAAQKPYELFRYGGAPHAFDEDSRPAFRPAAAHEAWSRTLTFLRWYLRPAITNAL